MNALSQHLRFGLRLIRKAPTFYTVVILVLALGIGANTAVFSVVDAVLLRKLPFRDPDKLVMVWEKNPTLRRHNRRAHSDCLRQFPGMGAPAACVRRHHRI